MTHAMKPAPRRAAIPTAILAALLLAGCSSGNIGESWQCPLAKGGSCDSVAAADPAVPDAGGRTALGEPLWQVRGSAPEARSEAVCTAGCGGGFDPFGWLRLLFGESNDGVVERSTARQPGAGDCREDGDHARRTGSRSGRGGPVGCPGGGGTAARGTGSRRPSGRTRRGGGTRGRRRSSHRRGGRAHLGRALRRCGRGLPRGRATSGWCWSPQAGG